MLLLKEKMTLECLVLVEETITGEVFSNLDQKEIGLYLVQFQHLISSYESQILVVSRVRKVSQAISDAT